uniref:Uncharacterized protein n=1 Tax=Ixodes ricinus TaxID=34613 RepID=A0A6B0UY91_IXORI
MSAAWATLGAAGTLDGPTATLGSTELFCSMPVSSAISVVATGRDVSELVGRPSTSSTRPSSSGSWGPVVPTSTSSRSSAFLDATSPFPSVLAASFILDSIRALSSARSTSSKSSTSSLSAELSVRRPSSEAPALADLPHSLSMSTSSDRTKAIFVKAALFVPRLCLVVAS